MLPMPDTEDGQRGETVTISVTFTGPFEGAMFVVLDRQMLAPLAANMLGMDFGEVPSDEHQADAARELLNVVCGNVLPAIAGAEAVFDVHAPLVESSPVPQTHHDRPAIATVRLALDEGLAQLYLFLDEEHLSKLRETLA